MAIDFSREEEQKDRNYGPVPSGSRVLVRMTLEKPKYASRNDPDIAETKNGLLQLPCKMSVVDGTYAGCSWYEYITLQADMQTIRLTESQQTACRIGGSTLRAIIEAHRGVDPKDKSPRADKARMINAWGDMDGMEFPARLGINRKGSEGKDGRIFWNNCIGRVLSVTDKEFPEIKRGAEFITDGATKGDDAPSTRSKNGSGDGPLPYDDAPLPDDSDLVPF